jgi:hypothetical protein
VDNFSKMGENGPESKEARKRRKTAIEAKKQRKAGADRLA